jgi:sulfur relay (sulfurtransferase) DsrF/TusC family protein
MKKLLFICSSKPSHNVAAEEYLDAALACAAMSFDVCICFAGDGLEQLERKNIPQSIKTKLEMTPLYDIEAVAVESQLNENEQIGINIKTVGQAEYRQLIDRYDHVIHL